MTFLWAHSTFLGIDIMAEWFYPGWLCTASFYCASIWWSAMVSTFVVIAAER
jgi:hypothetical protein